MAKQLTSVTAKDLVLLEASATRAHEPGDEHRFSDAKVAVEISVNYGIVDIGIEDSGTEAVATVQCEVIEKLKVTPGEGEPFTRENRIACAYRALLGLSLRGEGEYDANEEEVSSLIHTASAYIHPNLRTKLRALSLDVFAQVFSLPPTWQEMLEFLEQEQRPAEDVEHAVPASR